MFRNWREAGDTESEAAALEGRTAVGVERGLQEAVAVVERAAPQPAGTGEQNSIRRCPNFCVSCNADAWLVDFVGHAAFELNGKKVQCAAPVFDGSGPLFADVLQAQVEELKGRINSGKKIAVAADFSKRAVERFDCVGGVNDLADFLRAIATPPFAHAVASRVIVLSAMPCSVST